MTKFLFSVALLFALIGCAVSQTVQPIGGAGGVSAKAIKGDSMNIVPAAADTAYIGWFKWGASTNGAMMVKTTTNELYYRINDRWYKAGGIGLADLSATAPLAYNNSTGVFSIPQANGSTNGYLSSTDWSTFNGKQNAITLTTTGNSGAATFSSGTLNIPNYTLAGLGGITGTGFARRVAYWTDANNLRFVSAMYYDSTNDRIGLATTTPRARLDVLDGIATGNDGWISINGSSLNYIISNSSTTTGAQRLYFAGNGYTFQNNAFSDIFTVSNAGVPLFAGLSGATTRIVTASTTGLLGASSTSALNIPTGSGANGQVTFWNGTNSQFGSNNLFWDNGNGRLGVNTAAPTYALDVRGDFYTQGVGAGGGSNFRIEHGGSNVTTFRGTSLVIAQSTVQLTPQNLAIGVTVGHNPVDFTMNGVSRFYVGSNNDGGRIGISTNAPNASAQMEIVSTSRGFLMPRMTSAQRAAIATPATGLVVYQTDGTSGFYFYTGSAWKYILGAGDVSAISSLNGLTGATQTFATGTSGTDFGISSTGTTHTFNLPTASASARGLLSSADWSTFNGKINLSSLSATAPLSYNSGTGAFSITQANGSTNGFLSSADWTTFNNKQNALTNPVTGTGTSGQVAYWNGTTTQTGSSNLFWDATNNRLGIGTSSPAVEADIRGILRVRSGLSTPYFNLEADNGGIRLYSYNSGGSAFSSMDFRAASWNGIDFGGTTRWNVNSSGVPTFNGLSGTGTRVTLASSTGQQSALANGSNGQVLTLVSGSPAWATASSGGSGLSGYAMWRGPYGQNYTVSANTFTKIMEYDAGDTFSDGADAVINTTNKRIELAAGIWEISVTFEANVSSITGGSNTKESLATIYINGTRDNRFDMKGTAVDVGNGYYVSRFTTTVMYNNSTGTDNIELYWSDEAGNSGTLSARRVSITCKKIAPPIT